MMMKRQVSNTSQTRDNPIEKKNEHFAKFLHPLWDLNLIQDHLKSRDDVLVFLAMSRYADFGTGECAVFISRIMRDTGIKHPNQVRRCMDRVARMGAFWQMPDKKGYKKVYGKSVRRYFRANGQQIITHAVENNLIGEEKLLEIELHQVEREIEAEAQKAAEGDHNGSAGQSGGAGGLEDFPETIDEVIEQMRKGKKE